MRYSAKKNTQPRRKNCKRNNVLHSSAHLQAGWLWQTSRAWGTRRPPPRLVWSRAQGKHSFYAWLPVPPTERFVALGMATTTSPDPPSIDTVRCIPKAWVTKTSFTPQQVGPPCAAPPPHPPPAFGLWLGSTSSGARCFLADGPTREVLLVFKVSKNVNVRGWEFSLKTLTPTCPLAHSPTCNIVWANFCFRGFS